MFKKAVNATIRRGNICCNWQKVVVLFLLSGFFQSYAGVLEQQRVDFLQAEQMIAAGDEQGYAAISPGLESYPLNFYLQYKWLSLHLGQDKQILNFLNHSTQSLYTRKLRRKWLNYLYKQGKWNTFVANYRSSKSKLMQCRYNWAEYQRNYKNKALTATQKIWLTGASLPKACDPLLEKFTQSSFLTQQLIWQRFMLAAKASHYNLATYLSKKLSSAGDRKKAELWLELIKKPQLISQTGFFQGVAKPLQAKMFTDAMKRLVSADVENAARLWDAQSSVFKLSAAQIYHIERAIALQFAFNKSEQAYARFNQLPHLDATTRLWAVRAALIEDNWRHVDQALGNLSAKEKKQERWRYWQAKALLQTNQREKSLVIFKQLANERSYYGFLAADFIQQDYALGNKPIILEAKNRSRLLSQQRFVIVSEFKALEMEKEAQQFWWEALRNLEGDDLLAAAKIAQQWHWHRLAILTVSRAKYWDDVALRFPIAYSDNIEQNAQLQQLDTSIIYSLVRRESMFDPAVGSPVGALGLMQIMPATGKQIAKEIRHPWRSKSVLLRPAVNVKFGAHYYKQMLGKFDGHFALAAAAYNAGPHNVDKWLKIERDYAADIWIETIPYKETRAYVAAILTYALIYQSRLQSGEVRMNDYMQDIKTRSKLATTQTNSGGE